MSKKTGRPSAYNEQVAAEICNRIASGESLTRICKDEHMPCTSTVMKWIFTDHNEIFSQQYAEARRCQAELFIDQINDIADEGSNDWMESNDPDNPGYKLNGEYYQRSRLRIDTRKWFASKVYPKIYGEAFVARIEGKVEHKHIAATTDEFLGEIIDVSPEVELLDKNVH